MASWNLHFVLVALLVFTLLETGSCLKCYNCTSVRNAHCMNPVGQVPSIVCQGSNVCVKHVTPSIALNVDGSGQADLPPKIIRGCRPNTFCKDLTNDFATHCSFCTADLCNSSTVVMPSFILICLYVVKCFINY